MSEVATDVVEGDPTPAESAPAVEEVQTQPGGDVSVDQTEVSGDDSPDGAEQSEKPKKEHWASKRIREKAEQARQAEAKAREFEERAAELEARLAQLQGEDESFPTLEQFDYDQNAYQKAMADHMSKVHQRTVQKAIAEQHRMEAQTAMERASRAAVDTFVERSNEFAEAHPDFRDTITSPSFVQTDAVRQAIILADNGPALAYHLAKNPAIADEVNGLPPMLAGMRLGQISAKLAAAPAAKTSKTPAPSAPVQPTGAVEKDPEKMSPREYMAYRLKERGE